MDEDVLITKGCHGTVHVMAQRSVAQKFEKSDANNYDDIQPVFPTSTEQEQQQQHCGKKRKKDEVVGDDKGRHAGDGSSSHTGEGVVSDDDDRINEVVGPEYKRSRAVVSPNSNSHINAGYEGDSCLDDILSDAMPVGGPSSEELKQLFKEMPPPPPSPPPLPPPPSLPAESTYYNIMQTIQPFFQR